MKLQHCGEGLTVTGPCGELRIRRDDEMALKLMMLIEGECEHRSPTKIAERYGYCRQRYYQLREAFRENGSAALISHKRGPKSKSRRTTETVRQIIRHRYLDPDASVGVIAQKLRQVGQEISTRSVSRVFQEYGLQKKGSTSAGPDPRTPSRRSQPNGPRPAGAPRRPIRSAWNTASGSCSPTKSAEP